MQMIMIIIYVKRRYYHAKCVKGKEVQKKLLSIVELVGFAPLLAVNSISSRRSGRSL